MNHITLLAPIFIDNDYIILISQELIILNMTLILIEDDPLLHELIPPDHLHEPNDWLCAT